MSDFLNLLSFTKKLENKVESLPVKTLICAHNNKKKQEWSSIGAYQGRAFFFTFFCIHNIEEGVLLKLVGNLLLFFLLSNFFS